MCQGSGCSPKRLGGRALLSRSPNHFCLSRALSLLFCVRASRTQAVERLLFDFAYHISESLLRFQSTVADTMRVLRLDWALLFFIKQLAMT